MTDHSALEVAPDFSSPIVREPNVDLQCSLITGQTCPVGEPQPAALSTQKGASTQVCALSSAREDIEDRKIQGPKERGINAKHVRRAAILLTSLLVALLAVTVTAICGWRKAVSEGKRADAAEQKAASHQQTAKYVIFVSVLD
jgi:hypothetical protein